MHQAAPAESSWKLLPWPLSASRSKPKDKLKKLSAFKKRFQAHAAIARTLSPFCARTSLDSLVFEEGKCLLAFSALLHGCSCASTAIKDAHVPSDQHRADFKAIQHDFLSSEQHGKAIQNHYYYRRDPSSKRGEIKAIEHANHHHHHRKDPSLENLASEHENHHHRQSPSFKRGELKAIEHDQGEIKAIEQGSQHLHRKNPSMRRGEIKAIEHGNHHHRKDSSSSRGEIKAIEHEKHHRRQNPSLKRGESKPIEQESHHRKDLSAVKGKTAQLNEDIHVSATMHLSEKNRGEIKSIEEDMHYRKDPSPRDMHRRKEPSLKDTHYNSSKDPSVKDTHHHASKDPSFKDTHYHASKDPPFKDTHNHACKDPSFKDTHYHAIKDPSFMDTHYHASKDPSFKDSHNHAGKDPSLKDTHSHAGKDPSLKDTHSHASKDPSLKETHSYASKDPSLKGDDKVSIETIPPLHRIATKREHTARSRQDHEKLKLVRSDHHHHHKVSGGVWMQDTVPVVKYSYNPYLDFHDSMLEMLLGRGLRDLQELQDMFVCYVLLNSPCHHKHIEKAFRDLLTDLYKCKLMKSVQHDEMEHTKT